MDFAFNSVELVNNHIIRLERFDVETGFLFLQVRNQDALYGISGVSWEGREVAWKWLQEKWEYIGDTWGSGFLITRFISAVVSPVCFPLIHP